MRALIKLRQKVQRVETAEVEFYLGPTLPTLEQLRLLAMDQADFKKAWVESDDEEEVLELTIVEAKFLSLEP